LKKNENDKENIKIKINKYQKRNNVRKTNKRKKNNIRTTLTIHATTHYWLRGNNSSSST
jgi:hypothetical protein